MKTDPRVDAYIARKADFARPILEHLRATVHAACPECEETLKWSSPTFMYRGEMLCSMAAFKAHAAFGFWKGSLVVGDGAEQLSAMGQFGRIESLDDLPRTEVLEALIAKAMKLTQEGVKAPRSKHVKEPLSVPQDLRAAIEAVPAFLPARICRMGHRGQARRDPRQAPRPDRRMAHRRQAPQLEV